MAMGRRRPVQQPVVVQSGELVRAPRHRLDAKFCELLDGAGSDLRVEWPRPTDGPRP
jgi:hypothetical protein